MDRQNIQLAPSFEITDANRFKLVRKIADGGMGSVWEAVQYGSDGFEKQVAIKTILETLTTDPEFVEMFIGEAKLVADLVHLNIVQMYQLGKVGNCYYIAMEFVHGINLQEFMNRHFELGQQVPMEMGVYIISRVARALEYAHKKADKQGQPLGVVHRDVSPKNVMINTEGVVKLTDFGIAKAAKLMRDQEGDVLMGKVQYMSPEQAQYMHTDGRSDIFSLGVVMYELMTGQSLFGSDRTSVVMDNVVYKPIPPLKNYVKTVPPEVERIFNRMLERDVKKRYQSAGDVAYEMEYFMYHDRFGPTVVTMEQYLRQLFPHLFVHTPPGGPSISRWDGTKNTPH